MRHEDSRKQHHVSIWCKGKHDQMEREEEKLRAKGKGHAPKLPLYAYTELCKDPAYRPSNRRNKTDVKAL